MQRGSFKKDDLIIDPFMGQGTTLRVAKKLGKSAIGIDLSERYCEMAAIQLGKPEAETDLPMFELLNQKGNQ